MAARRKRKDAETEIPIIPPTLETGSSLFATEIDIATASVTAITIVEWPSEKNRPHVRLQVEAFSFVYNNGGIGHTVSGL